jgi:hypothetical protein
MDIFFHCYCINNFATVLIEKLKKIKQSGLYDAVDKIYMPVFNFYPHHQEFIDDIRNVYSKIELSFISNAQFNSEPDTLNLMLKKSLEYTENTKLLYLHTKGVSHLHPNMRKNIDAWVRYLDLYNIAKWEECVNALDTHDVAGGLYVEDPKHFSGNFWWANSDYIKTLPRINQYNINEYNRGEFWVCSNTNTAYPVSMNAPVDLYHNYYCNEEDFPDGF